MLTTTQLRHLQSEQLLLIMNCALLTSHSVSGVPIPIKVGKKKFHIHIGTLTATSDFFKNAMKPRWRANSKKQIDLSDEEPEDFESYVNWLYSRKVAVTRPLVGRHIQLARLYVLGERLVDETFQNAVLSAMIYHAVERDSFPPEAAINIIYSGTGSASSPARRLMVDMFVYACDEDWIITGSLIEETSVEFVDDLVRGFIRSCTKYPINQKLSPWVVAPEQYGSAALRAEQNKGEETENAKDELMDTSD